MDSLIYLLTKFSGTVGDSYIVPQAIHGLHDITDNGTGRKIRGDIVGYLVFVLFIWVNAVFNPLFPINKYFNPKLRKVVTPVGQLPCCINCQIMSCEFQVDHFICRKSIFWDHYLPLYKFICKYLNKLCRYILVNIFWCSL